MRIDATYKSVRVLTVVTAQHVLRQAAGAAWRSERTAGLMALILTTWRALPTGYSDHALRRARERKISIAAMEAAVAYGARTSQVDGREVCDLNEAAIQTAARYDGENLRRFRGVRVIIAPDGVVVTVLPSTCAITAQGCAR